MDEEYKDKVVEHILDYCKKEMDDYSGDVIVYFNDNTKRYIDIPGYSALNVIVVFEQDEDDPELFHMNKCPKLGRNLDTIIIHGDKHLSVASELDNKFFKGLLGDDCED